MKDKSEFAKIGILEYEVLDDSRALDLFCNWRSEFCPDLKLSQKSGYAWESISGVFLEEALDCYKSHNSVYYYVLLEPNKGYLKVALTKTKPFYQDPYRYDYYVFPKNLAWCMSFTHEDGWLGPIFSKHSNFKLLNKKNVQATQSF